MNKSVVILSSSLHANSNSEHLAKAFASGAESVGNKVTSINLRGKRIGFCIGCLACEGTGKCVLHDDMADICAAVKQADVVVFATPIYYYEMSGQLKTVLDRLNPLYDSDYKFTDVYLLSTAADDSADTDKRALYGLEGWIECFPRAHLADSLFVGGVTDGGAIVGNEGLDKAYAMGQNV